MQMYWLTNRKTGEETLVDGDTVARVLGVEISYVDWCVKVDGVFENEAWKARLGK